MKSEIRAECRKLRANMPKEQVLSKSASAAAHFINSDIYINCRCIMLYMPLGNEADTTVIFQHALADDKSVVLPVTDEHTGIITPCFASEDSDYEKGGFSVREPRIKKNADVSEIDVILVPGIAFDTSGARVGFGKGCYDRLLAVASAVKVGYCYGFQLQNSIPNDIYDIPMDYIVTEDGMIKCCHKE